MNERELLEKFESYLKGELRGQEREDLERLIEQDPEVREKFAEHKTFLHKIKSFGKRKAIVALAKDAQNEIDGQRRKFVFYKNSFFIGMAASVLLVIVAAVSFYSGYLYSSEASSQKSYKNLSIEVKNIKEQQEAISKILDTKEESHPEKKADLAGTAFAISSKGYLLTCNHVLKGADSVLVYNETLGAITAKVVSASKEYDLALLKIDTKNNAAFKVPYIIRRREAEPGEGVFTMGYPRNEMVYGDGSVSSSTGYNGDTLQYQISIPVNPGNSGAPLLDAQGNLTGIIKGKQDKSEGTGFAVKAKYIEQFLKSVEGEETPVSVYGRNIISKLGRKEQVKKLKPVVFQVKVYQ